MNIINQNQNLKNSSPNLITNKQVMEKLKISRTSLHRLEKTVGFPKKIKIGKLSRWIETDIDQYIYSSATQDKEARFA